MPTKPKRKSPLKTKPLRQAGQSLAEEIDEVIGTRIMPWVSLIIVFLILAAFEWLRWWQATPPQPVVASIIAVVVCGVGVRKIWRELPNARNLTLGRQGEIVVSQCLDKLKADGYRVFDDIVGDRFNVDHVLVGPGGVFAIETKTRSKPEGDARVVYDGENLTVNGYTDNSPIEEAEGEARHIEEIIESVVSNIKVQPVIIFPGWFVSKTGDSDVWVFNEKHFMKWTEDRWTRLPDDQVRLISKAIEVHVRGGIR